MLDTDLAAPRDTALWLLPPELASQLLFSRYVWAGASAVFIWDILSNLKADYMLLFNYRLAWPVAAYFLSRITSVACVIGCTVFLTYPVGECRTFHLALGFLYPIAIPSTSLLFFFRVRAVYGHTRRVTIIFGLMWIAVLGTCIVVPIATGGVNIGPTRYCILGELGMFAAAIGVGLFDTAVFLAISYELVRNTHVEHPSLKQKPHTFVIGAYLPSFSKSLLVDGQVYYLITTVVNILAFVLLCFSGLGSAYRSFLTIPNMMLTNVMACRVYRHTRLDLAQQSFMFPTAFQGDFAGNISVELTPQSQSGSRTGTEDWEADSR
ncbi:hypothetical protein K438DRAFT_1938159 [Mycena galopus ATCC 62051]|nr:hypothetical protein K438DRAFT_1938159 [Mycena galopus ATCC 62051]